MGRLELPDKVRDEDAPPEIGSEAWVRAEIAAGRSGEERDAYLTALTQLSQRLPGGYK